MQAKGKFKAEDQQLVGETWAWREKVQRSMDGARSTSNALRKTGYCTETTANLAGASVK